MCLNHQLGSFTPEKADAFANRLVAALNEGALCAMLSIGHRTGLLDALDGQSALTSSDYFSDQARLWLANEYTPMRFTVEQILDYPEVVRERYTPVR